MTPCPAHRRVQQGIRDDEARVAPTTHLHDRTSERWLGKLGKNTHPVRQRHARETASTIALRYEAGAQVGSEPIDIGARCRAES